MKAVFSLALGLLVGSAAQAQLVRENNSTLKFPTSATSPGQFELVEVFPDIQFDRPVCVATPPGETDRIFVVERFGRIWTVSNFQAPVKELFLDISGQVNASDWQQNRRTEGLSSIAFHPNFAENHRFFVTYNTVTTTDAGTGHHNRVAEFRADNDNRQAVASSEIALITQYDEGDGHNINDLHFGSDGYLYIATGDEGDGGTGDDFNNAQKIDKDFFSAIMRIDVDKKSGNLAPNPHPASNSQAYKIPADNPFVGAASFNGIPIDPMKVRTEFYAVGLRNPWRFSFDPQTGAIFEGDVGQHGREEINIITKGGNYGWSFKEGTLNGPKSGSAPSGFNFTPPIYEFGTGFGPDQGFSVTGGVVYRAAGIPSLNGHLIFADYVSGNLWSMNIDAQPYNKPTRLLGQTGIASFGYDPRNNEVLAVNHDAGKILRLQYTTGVPNNVPTSLDQTGIFANLSTLQPNSGIYPYDVNVPLWSDDALKRRWFSIPAGQQIKFHPQTNWVFPTGSIFVKHFEILTNFNNPASVVRLETRVLVKTDAGVYGVTYKWNDAGTAATLVPDEGDSRGLVINTGSNSRRQTWHFPSRSQCLSCHTAAGGRVLGFNTPQLNREFGYSSGAANQISALSSAGFFSNPPAHARGLYALAAVNDNSVSRAYRVRSYLAANCGQCHQPAANTYAGWDARIDTPLSAASIIYGPLLNSIGSDSKVITPGDPAKSALLTRMRSFGADRMPPLGTSVLDSAAAQLINDWIAQDLATFESYQAWAGRMFNGTVPPQNEDNDADGISNFTEYLMGTNPTQPTAGASIFTLQPNGQGIIHFPHPANRAILIETADNLPADAWRLLDHPENKMLFPAQTMQRNFTLPLNGPGKYFRLGVIEP